MLFETETLEARLFAKRIAATAIVNQAAIRCLMNGLPVTESNVVRMIGDFVDPERPEASELIDAVMKAIDDLVANSIHSFRSLDN